MGDNKLKGISTFQGVSFYVAAILGSGLLIMPSLAASIAGPASLISWVVLIFFCIPVALTFAQLGGRYPNAGGIAHFSKQAFNKRSGAIVGYWFYFAVPFCAPVTAIVASNYIAHAMNLTNTTDKTLLAGLLLFTAVVSNYFKIKVSARMQLSLLAILSVVLFIACITALKDAHVANLHPFMPYGYGSVFSSTALLFFSFAGWEAVTHLSHEFSNPQQQLKIVAVWTIIFISAFYLLISFTTITVLGAESKKTEVPITKLLEVQFGSSAARITAILAVILAFGVNNAYYTGAARLGASLAKDGDLPVLLSKGANAGEVPRRSLSLLAIMSGIVFGFIVYYSVSLKILISVASALFIIVTIAGLASGVKLLPRLTFGWWCATVAVTIMGLLFINCGYAILVPLGIATIGWLYQKIKPLLR